MNKIAYFLILILTIVSSANANLMAQSSKKGDAYVDVNNAERYIKLLKNEIKKSNIIIYNLEKENSEYNNNIKSMTAYSGRIKPVISKIEKEIEVYWRDFSKDIINETTNKEAVRLYKLNIQNKHKLKRKVAELNNRITDAKKEIDKNNRVISDLKLNIKKSNDRINFVQSNINKTNGYVKDVKSYSDKAIALNKEANAILNQDDDMSKVNKMKVNRNN